MSAYYNEIDKYCVQWLRNLIAAGLVAPGDVDDRPIQEVKPDDLAGYTQHHFFAGIGGWSLALRLAGWPDARPVWTGSCPCQPFSSTGKYRRQSDERHLWPDWARLIRKCLPSEVLGEQVERSVTAGWLDDAFHDLEESAYACASAVLRSCSIQDAHERSRVYFAAHIVGARLERHIPNRQPIFPDEDAISARRQLSRALATQDWGWFESQSGIRPLADGVPGRMGKIRAFGNAISPWLAAEFISAYMEATNDCYFA